MNSRLSSSTLRRRLCTCRGYKLLLSSLSTYSHYATTRPYITNTISGATLGFIGDQICQRFIETEGDGGVSWKRSLAMTIFCGYYQGGVDTYIYHLYHYKLPIPRSMSTFGKGMIISLIDNFIHVPLLYTPAFYSTLGLLQQHSMSETIDTMKREYYSTITLCWSMWIPLQLVNFTIVPRRYQVVIVMIESLLVVLLILLLGIIR